MCKIRQNKSYHKVQLPERAAPSTFPLNPIGRTATAKAYRNPALPSCIFIIRLGIPDRRVGGQQCAATRPEHCRKHIVLARHDPLLPLKGSQLVWYSLHVCVCISADVEPGGTFPSGEMYFRCMFLGSSM